jgi:hypothetical protein
MWSPQAEVGGDMELTMTLAASLVLVAVTVAIHYEVLRGTSLLIPRLSISPRPRLLVVIAGVFVAHLLEVSLYAGAFYVMVEHLGLGSIRGEFQGAAIDYFYFSITSYTTLGVGDVYPHGALRVITGLEALNGFVMIGWSASFTYVAMERFWQDHG